MCQSMSSSKLLSRLKSTQTTILRARPSLTDFWCQCACAPVQWSHLGLFPLWCGEVRFFWFLCFGGLSDCRICGNCAFYLSSKITVCMYGFDAFVVCVYLHCQCHQSVCVGFIQHLESDFQFAVFVSSSSLFFRFQYFLSDVYLLDCCTLSAACAL